MLAHDLQVADDRVTHQSDAFVVGGSGGNTAQEVAPCAETTSLIQLEAGLGIAAHDVEAEFLNRS